MLDFLNIRGFEDALLVVCFCILVFVVGYFVTDWIRLIRVKVSGGKPDSGGYVDTPDVTPVETVASLTEKIEVLKLSLFMKEQALAEAKDGMAELTLLKAHMESVDSLLVAANNYIIALEELRESSSNTTTGAESFDFFALLSGALSDLGTPANVYEAGVYNGLAAAISMSGESVGMVDPKKYPQPAKPFARGKDGRFCKATA